MIIAPTFWSASRGHPNADKDVGYCPMRTAAQFGTCISRAQALGNNFSRTTYTALDLAA